AVRGGAEVAVAGGLDVLVAAPVFGVPEPDGYGFHDLLGVYAADRARTQETEQDRTAATARLLTWYLHTAEAAARVISPQRRQVPLDPVRPPPRPVEFGDLDAALAWCEDERPQ